MVPANGTGCGCKGMTMQEKTSEIISTALKFAVDLVMRDYLSRYGFSNKKTTLRASFFYWYG